MPRLTRIYTRTGDDGSTGLSDGQRVRKDSARINAIGELDELNSLIGVVRAAIASDPPVGAALAAKGQSRDLDDILLSIQHRLFDLGGELALPGQTLVQAHWVERLEQWLDRLNEQLPPLQEFVLPGGNLPAAHCHQARAVCRRAERNLLQLSQTEEVNSAALKYLNRLSDLLFVMARVLARRDGGCEVLWQKDME